ncbi:MAG: hypothetical protein FWD40_09240 [Treponema sp.]|nr:hypothetical protein [Treponema sp.]
MKKIAILLILPFFAQALFANENTAPANELVLQATSMPEAKLEYKRHFIYPFLQSDNPLMADNNIKFTLSGQLTPISVNGLLDLILTPVAFAELSAGGRLGSGWPVNLFGSNLYGIGLNLPGNEHEGSAFDALLWKAYAGAALQFSLAAIFPGDWNNIIARTYHEINIHGNTRAKAGEAWYFENDGENCNGLNYYGNFVIGYQMPIILSMAALLAEADLYLYDTPGREKWGDDIVRWIFSCVFNFSVTNYLDITLLTQCRTRRNFIESNWNDLYYRSRTVDTSNPVHLEFYRIAAVVTYRF